MECSRGSFGYSEMARRKYSDGVAAHTNIAGCGDDCGQGGWGRYWGAGGLLIQAGEFIVEPGEEGLFQQSLPEDVDDGTCNVDH